MVDQQGYAPWTRRCKRHVLLLSPQAHVSIRILSQESCCSQRKRNTLRLTNRGMQLEE